ncbi:MAG: Fe-S protein assembly co-chaperone HscB [Lautropia sp.]
MSSVQAKSPVTRSHFELFGLPETFAIDQAELDSRFRRYQAAVHPDRYAAGSDAERRLALQLAANGNEAYRTLSDPMRRAAYLCERHGVAIDAERNTAMPADFLVAQIEWREAIDDVRGKPRAAALALGAQLAAERDAVIGRIGAQLDDARDYAAAAAGVRRLMFFDRLQAELREVLRRPEAGPR